MKDLIISWNEGRGFYHGDDQHDMFFVILANMIEKYSLKTDRTLKSNSEIEMYFSIKETNKEDYNIELLEEDGSEWIFG